MPLRSDPNFVYACEEKEQVRTWVKWGYISKITDLGREEELESLRT